MQQSSSRVELKQAEVPTTGRGWDHLVTMQDTLHCGTPEGHKVSIVNFGKTQVSALLDFGQNENIFNFGGRNSLGDHLSLPTFYVRYRIASVL